MSRLLNLPTEVRLAIYEFVFAGSVVSKPSWSRDRSCDSWDSSKSQHHILQTCRQTYAEARQLFYSTNLWSVENLFGRDSLRNWTAHLQAHWIKHVRMTYLEGLYHLVEEDLPGLETLTVVVDDTGDHNLLWHYCFFEDHYRQDLVDRCVRRVTVWNAHSQKIWETLSQRKALTVLVELHLKAYAPMSQMHLHPKQVVSQLPICYWTLCGL